MTSALLNPTRDTITLGIETPPTPSDTIAKPEHQRQECSLGDIHERDDVCNGRANKDDEEDESLVQETFRVLNRPRHRSNTDSKSPSPRAMSVKRPLLQKKSFSDLATYKDVHMKILVEGKEVLDTCFNGKYFSSGLSGSPQETSADGHQVTESLQREQVDTKKHGKFFAGWFAKRTQSKSQNDQNSGGKLKPEPPIGFRSLRRSRSFSGRIKDKIKSITPSHAVRSNYLQPPLFYKIIDLKNVNREDNAFLGNYQRRHSDQTDSMSRRPLGARQDIQSSKCYTMSLERGLRQRTASDKKPLVRNTTNSLEKLYEFPFWSQITDANRSRSCNARIRVLETLRNTNGMLETNLCSTEL